jgi:hypothetical protein
MPDGGKKTVVALSTDTALLYAGVRRSDLLADAGEIIELLGGRCVACPDVGTSPQDIATIGRHTSAVLCRPPGAGAAELAGSIS